MNRRDFGQAALATVLSLPFLTWLRPTRQIIAVKNELMPPGNVQEGKHIICIILNGEWVVVAGEC